MFCVMLHLSDSGEKKQNAIRQCSFPTHTCPWHDFGDPPAYKCLGGGNKHKNQADVIFKQLFIGYTPCGKI